MTKKKKEENQMSLLAAEANPTPVEGVAYAGRCVRKDGGAWFPVVDVIKALVDSADPT